MNTTYVMCFLEYLPPTLLVQEISLFPSHILSSPPLGSPRVTRYLDGLMEKLFFRDVCVCMRAFVRARLGTTYSILGLGGVCVCGGGGG